VAKNSLQPRFLQRQAGSRRSSPAISSPQLPSTATGTTFVLHHNEADNLNTRALCGTGFAHFHTTPINDLRFLLRQGCTAFYPPPCGLSFFSIRIQSLSTSLSFAWKRAAAGTISFACPAPSQDSL